MQNKAWRAKIAFLKNEIYLCNVYYYLTVMYIICRQILKDDFERSV